MPKGKKNKSNVDMVADVKLSDFADTSARNGRLKKSIGNLNQDKLKDLQEEPLWFEKDIEDFKLLRIAGENSRKKSRAPPEASDGVRYPADVWFLLGGYIQPEQVKLFASICKDSYHVSRSYCFWINIYKRYHDSSLPLPPRLQPECVAQALCLKALVVRALHHTYPLFRALPPKGDVGGLKGRVCTLTWRLQQPGGRWLFHFKFQPSHARPTVPPLRCGVAVQRLWAGDQPVESQEAYVVHNPDEGCCILRFACTHFVAVPPGVMGSRLSGARAPLAHDMRRHRLRLSFSKEEVEFDAVENLAILEWWHPQYPFDYF